ncbi:response regulator [Trinickia acidisoli]|uniref:response regulator n=1 Tax=Trinickia acidisoli TaxID=2767482 RepID=UPI001A8C4CAF|nr:response regulator [Trinickia acidisoli]
MKSDWYSAQGTVANGTDEPGETHARHRKRVLIADRDEAARSMLVNLVESLGYEAVAARNTEEAFEIARRAPPDAALIDIGAPLLEGLPAARRMRELAGQSALLLIALTGWGQPQYRDMALAAGYDVHLVKPVGVDQLGFLLSMTLV